MRFIVFCLFLYINVSGQNKDSLLLIANKAPADTLNIKALNELASASSRETDYISALKYAEQAKQLSGKLNFKRGQFSSAYIMGIAYWHQGNYPDAQKYCLYALSVAEVLKDNKLLSSAYNALANINYSTQNTDQALYYYNQSLQTGILLNDKINVVKANLGLGDVYSEFLDDTAQALKYYYKALSIAQEINDSADMAIIYNNIGTIYLDGNINKSLPYFIRSAELNREFGNMYNVAISYINIAYCYAHQKNYVLAKDFLNQSLMLGKQAGAKELLQEAYHIGYIIDSLKGDYKGVFNNYKMFELYGDSIQNLDAEKRLLEQQMQYQFDKKEAVAKEEQKKKDALSLAEKQRNRIVFILGVIVLLLVMVFGGFMYNRFKVTQKQKKIIEQKEQETQLQKKLVEEKQNEILDSINYAKRLQDAILPPQEFISQFLPDHFVLYKPKDIVAGDFYWAYKISNSANIDLNGKPSDLFFIAAADSTGHGVPGAMVSLVCSNALNRAVKEFKLTCTGEILDKTRELVIETFEKSASEVKDGMDISLLCIDFSNRKIQWSGANNPLWYITGEVQGGVLENQIFEIKPDKQPIGKTDKPKPFTTHSIEYKEKTIFYLFTDGLADQFGGPIGKKFKYKQFSELLLSISKMSMPVQSESIYRSFENWKGKLEQVDDVCVVGIRL